MSKQIAFDTVKNEMGSFEISTIRTTPEGLPLLRISSLRTQITKT